MKDRSVFDDAIQETDRENDNRVALKAAVPTIPRLPDDGSSSEQVLEHAIFRTELLIVNQNHT